MNHVREIVLGMKPQSVLEVGCGDAYLLGTLAPLTNARCVGVDLSPRAIAHAKALHPQIEFINGNLADVDGTFDVTVSIESLEHIPDQGVSFYLNAMADRTKDGGYAVICVPSTVRTPESTSSSHYRHYTAAVLQRELDESHAPFTIVKSEYIVKKSWWTQYFIRLLYSRWVILDIWFVRRFIWWYTWRMLRYGNERSGFHYIATLQKKTPNR